MSEVDFTVRWSSPVPYEGKYSKAIPNHDGVYEILVKRKGSSDSNRRYVGQGNLSDRYLAHLGKDEPNECIKDKVANYAVYFRYHVDEIPAEDDRVDLEMTLFKRWKHQCNDPRQIRDSGRNYSIRLKEIASDEHPKIPS